MIREKRSPIQRWSSPTIQLAKRSRPSARFDPIRLGADVSGQYARLRRAADGPQKSTPEGVAYRCRPLRGLRSLFLTRSWGSRPRRFFDFHDQRQRLSLIARPCGRAGPVTNAVLKSSWKRGSSLRSLSVIFATWTRWSAFSMDLPRIIFIQEVVRNDQALFIFSQRDVMRTAAGARSSTLSTFGAAADSTYRTLTTFPAIFIEMKRRLPSRVMRISCGQPPWAIVAKSKTAVAVSSTRIQQVKFVVSHPGGVRAFLRVIGNQFHIDGAGRRLGSVIVLRIFRFLKSQTRTLPRSSRSPGDGMQGRGRTR